MREEGHDRAFVFATYYTLTSEDIYSAIALLLAWPFLALPGVYRHLVVDRTASSLTHFT